VESNYGAPRDAEGFDRYALQYDAFVGECLRLTGEGKEYFARGRLNWLARRLRQLDFEAKEVIDFGCGTGTTIPLFFEILGARHVTALEASSELLNLARRDHGRRDASFSLQSDYMGRGDADLVFCSGVFHHISPTARLAMAREIYGYLRPGGLFSLWEHNGWSPAARYVMSRCEFDHDAQPLSRLSARRLLAAAGFEIVSIDFHFIFPRFLRFLRWSERLFIRVPLGAQFQVLGRKIA
jgi:SAM-dependent methyltransferase